jgi:hypothetical protein
LASQPLRKGRALPAPAYRKVWKAAVEQARATIIPAEIAELSDQLDFDSGVVEILRDVFLRACGTLEVSQPNDPLSAAIARTLISLAMAAQGECDAGELYRRTISKLRPLQ